METETIKRLEKRILHTHQKFTSNYKQKQLNHSQQIQFKLATSDDGSKRKVVSTTKTTVT